MEGMPWAGEGAAASSRHLEVTAPLADSPPSADVPGLRMEPLGVSETRVQRLCKSLQKLQKPNDCSVSRGC